MALAFPIAHRSQQNAWLFLRGQAGGAVQVKVSRIHHQCVSTVVCVLRSVANQRKSSIAGGRQRRRAAPLYPHPAADAPQPQRSSPAPQQPATGLQFGQHEINHQSKRIHWLCAACPHRSQRVDTGRRGRGRRGRRGGQGVNLMFGMQGDGGRDGGGVGWVCGCRVQENRICGVGIKGTGEGGICLLRSKVWGFSSE